jgi:acetyltransferase-like isoleucine patch superfamily enzyme
MNMKILIKNIFNFLRFINYKNIQIGKNTTISLFTKVRCLPQAKIIIGKNVNIYEYCLIDAGKSLLEIGDNTNIHRLVTLSAGKYSKLIIGNNVLIAEKTSIFASNHQFREKDILINQRGIVSKGIVIEDDVWIGVNCIILDGVRIAKGCVIVPEVC